MALLEIRGLTVAFAQYAGGWRRRTIQAVRDMELDVEAGEIVAVVGSSGSGKSLLAHAILGILPPNASMTGSVRYDGEPLTPERLDKLRGRELALIPQSVAYLDPLMRVGEQVRHSAAGGDPAESQRRAFRRLGLPEEAARRYPFQLSGGMARRVLVSTAVVSGARLIVADEPTPGLHEDVVRETLGQFRELADSGCGVLLITHDIASALTVADRVAVLYAGTTVEIADVGDFAGEGDALRHPYARALWRALPQNAFEPIPGHQPSPDRLPPGCLFAPRCALATAACEQARPEMRQLRGGKARCIHAT